MTNTVLRQRTSQWLRAETRVEHQEAEDSLDIGALRSPARCYGLLLGWRTVWRQVAVAASAPTTAGAAAAELQPMARAALAWLELDLAAVDSRWLSGAGSAARRPTGPNAAPGGAVATELERLLAQPPAGWGVAYVLRGSRLGGTLLAPRVQDALGLPAGSGTRFLASAGSEPGRDWVAFRTRLDDLVLSPLEQAVAVEAARWTFRWVTRTLVAQW